MEKLNVLDTIISTRKVNQELYICLTDIAKSTNKSSDLLIQNWMRQKNTIEYLGLWEIVYNKDFKPLEFEGFKYEAGSNSFILSPRQWIEKTNAIGMISKSGRYGGGTYAHSDIAFKFASWISTEFELYLIKEFQRLRKSEYTQLEWNIGRELAKVNYHIHTDAVKNYIVPVLSEVQVNIVYASEADLLNVALFGVTAKTWKETHTGKQGNIRDYASLEELIVLSNLESINSILIKEGLSTKERLIKLNEIARSQMKILIERLNKSINKMQISQDDTEK